MWTATEKYLYCLSIPLRKAVFIKNKYFLMFNSNGSSSDTATRSYISSVRFRFSWHKNGQRTVTLWQGWDKNLRLFNLMVLISLQPFIKCRQSYWFKFIQWRNCPFIKDIFTNKYPRVVALQSLCRRKRITYFGIHTFKITGRRRISHTVSAFCMD